MKKAVKKAVKSMIEKQISFDANSTTCVIAFQPKAPANLKKFSKIDNDK